jgi:predicted GNAT superfamily acetyltransferase
MNVKESTSFCEQKEAKKLYPLWSRAFSTPREAEQKSFLVTFFQKSNVLSHA